MGPMYGEPMCPCKMAGLPRSEEYKTYMLPENVAAREAEITKVFAEIFARRKEKNV
jgi:hypothetical protein